MRIHVLMFKQSPGDDIGIARRKKNWVYRHVSKTVFKQTGRSRRNRCGDDEIGGDIEDPYMLCGNYGVNRAICKDSWVAIGDEFKGKPLSLNQVRSPSSTLLVMDSGYSLISWRGATSDAQPFFENPRREDVFYVPGLSVNKDRDISPGSNDDAIAGRHFGRFVNVGFSDAHVEKIKAEKMAVQGVEGVYENIPLLWSPK